MPAEEINIAHKDIAVIIPAYNPPEKMLAVCEELVANNFSVFVVDDGSTNAGVFKLLAALPVIQMRHKVNLGQGAALETGILKALNAGKKFFVTFDADGQHDTEAVSALLQQLVKSGADIVFGSRFLNKKAALKVPPIKRITLRSGARFEAVMTGIRLSDSHNGLRAFTEQVAKNIHFRENRMAHATEILWLTKKHQWKYSECPVFIHYEKKSQHPLRSIEILIDLFLRKIIS